MSTEKPQSSATPNMLRRKLFKGTYGGVGVLLAVQAKTALGGAICQSPSAMMSGNVSQRPNTGITCSGGRSPGFWKVPQKFSYWKGATPPTFNVELELCQLEYSDLKPSDISNPGTLLSTLFAGAPAVSMWVALAIPNDPLFDGQGQLLRHLSAAWLNANYFLGSSEQYPLTPGQVQEMWNDLKGIGVYCPGPDNCGTKGWTAENVINYIKNMYDINSEVDSPLCKKNS